MVHEILRDYDMVDEDGASCSTPRPTPGENAGSYVHRYENGVPVVLYPTMGQGARIRDARTGIPTEHFMGSREEDLYFTARDVSRAPTTVPQKLFFASPTDWANAFFPVHKRPIQDTADWYERRDAMLRDDTRRALRETRVSVAGQYTEDHVLRVGDRCFEARITSHPENAAWYLARSAES